jgi:AraC-like DNA-binding protein
VDPIPERPPFSFRKIELVGLGVRIHGPLRPWSWRTTLPHFNFWFLIQGSGRLSCQGQLHTLEPGTCFLFPPGSRISGHSDSKEPIVNFSVHFFPKPRRNIPARTIELFRGRKVHRMTLFLELARHGSDAYRRGDSLGRWQAELAALQMMLHLWREISDPAPRKRDDRILQLLSQAGKGHFAAIPELAREAGLSTSQFTRRTSALTGIAPAEYLIRERMGHACTLLTETSQSIAEIADTLGYSDPSYFVRQFRALMKLTPARFRRKASK